MDIINMRSYSDPINFVTNNCKIVYNIEAKDSVELELEDRSILIIESFKAYIDLCADGKIIKSRPIKDGVKMLVNNKELLKYLINKDQIGNFKYRNFNIKEVEEYKIKCNNDEFSIIKFII